MKNLIIALSVVCILLSAGMACCEDQAVCKNLPQLQNLNCEDQDAVLAGLNALHQCMKSRFTYNGHITAAAWPQVQVPESGQIEGGDGEWSIGCLEAWPCKMKRLAFLQKEDELPYLVMASGSYLVDFNLDKVYHRDQLKSYKVLKISGLTPDSPWFKVDIENK